MRQRSRGGLNNYIYRQAADGISTRDAVVSIKWEPIDGSPQETAFESEADILGYGGGAGGGKTDLAIGKAVKKHFRTLILRREFNQLKGAIERAKEIVGKSGRYNSSEKLYRLTGGKRIEFGGIEHDGDEEAWQGRDHDFKVFDEATHFKEKVVRYVCIWNRTVRRGQRCQTLLTFNPPTTVSGAWVYNWFKPWLDKDSTRPALPGELRYFVTRKGKDTEVTPAFEVEIPDTFGVHSRPTIAGEFEPAEGMARVELDRLEAAGVAQIDYSIFKLPRVTIGGKVYIASPRAVEFEDEPLPLVPLSRTFIPARTTDNPYLTPQYLAQLDALPEPLRSMFKYGKFDALSEDEPWQVFPSAWIKAAMDRWKDIPVLDRGRLDAIGADIARGGQGKTAVAKRYGVYFPALKVYDGYETPDGPTAAAVIMNEHVGDANILVDVGGPGGSPYDSLKAQIENPGFAGVVEGINFASGCDMRDRSGKLGMANLRAGMHWNLREMLDPEFGQNIALPPDEDLRLDLLSIKWKLTARGILIFDKEDLSKKTGRGFHHSDAVILAAWITHRAQVSADPSLLSMFTP